MKQYEIKDFLDKLGKVFTQALKQLQRVKIVVSYVETLVNQVDATQKAAVDEISMLSLCRPSLVSYV
jgi:hypothetical protein